MKIAHRILAHWIDIMFHCFGEPSQAKRKPRRWHEVTPAEFWCVYLFVIFPLIVVGLVAAWERWA